MFHRLKDGFARFMYGRYGTDKLNMALLILGVVLTLLGSITNLYALGVLAYLPLIAVLYRMFSRNITRRQRENQRFNQFFIRIKDRNSRYFSCPRCHQTVRVPRGRGKINIHCPKCGNYFVKKS